MTQKRHRINPLILARARKLRRPQTPAEQKLWARLRNRQLGGLKFRRQHPIGRFILDFCCVKRKLAIELDGPSHASQVEYDRDRTAWLEQKGYKVIRFTNAQVHHNLEGVLLEIARQCKTPL